MRGIVEPDTVRFDIRLQAGKRDGILVAGPSPGSKKGGLSAAGHIRARREGGGEGTGILGSTRSSVLCQETCSTNFR